MSPYFGSHMKEAARFLSRGSYSGPSSTNKTCKDSSITKEPGTTSKCAKHYLILNMSNFVSIWGTISFPSSIDVLRHNIMPSGRPLSHAFLYDVYLLSYMFIAKLLATGKYTESVPTQRPRLRNELSSKTKSDRRTADGRLS